MAEKKSLGQEFTKGIIKENPVLSLNSGDIRPSIRRPKSPDIATKVNGIATLLSHGFALEDAIGCIPFFNDATEVISRSGEGVRKYQDYAVFGDGEEETEPNNDRIMSDLSDQNPESAILNAT